MLDRPARGWPLVVMFALLFPQLFAGLRASRTDAEYRLGTAREHPDDWQCALASKPDMAYFLAAVCERTAPEAVLGLPPYDFSYIELASVGHVHGLVYPRGVIHSPILTLDAIDPRVTHVLAPGSMDLRHLGPTVYRHAPRHEADRFADFRVVEVDRAPDEGE